VRKTAVKLMPSFVTATLLALLCSCARPGETRMVEVPRIVTCPVPPFPVLTPAELLTEGKVTIEGTEVDVVILGIEDAANLGGYLAGVDRWRMFVEACPGVTLGEPGVGKALDKAVEEGGLRDSAAGEVE
jgi:hypothetical protein